MTSSRLERWRRLVDKRMDEVRATKAQLTQERGFLVSLEARHKALEEATVLVQTVAAQVQTRAHRKIASIVTRALEIFEEPYTFRINFERKRGRTEARLVFERDGLEVDPLGASGGGCVLVAAFALRVACVCLTRPPKRRFMALDEPFHFVSEEYPRKLRRLLLTLARDMGMQFLIVTHNTQLRAGTVVTLD